MDRNNQKRLSLWIDQRLSVLDPDAYWQPNVDAGFVQLKTTPPTASWFARRWGWTVAAAASICLFLVVRPSPAVIVHKCLECSVAVWQTFAASGSPQAGVQPQNARDAAPDFHLLDENRNVISISGLKGKVILVNFWATWCHGCQTEIPWFIEFQKAYRDRGLVVVGITMNEDGWKSVDPWLKQRKPKLPHRHWRPGAGEAIRTRVHAPYGPD
jgi:thiol-disulfide isomerase/thioredoxin